LIRHGMPDGASPLRDPQRFHEVDLRPPGDETVSWRLFVASGFPVPVSWLDAVRGIAAVPDDIQLFGQSAGAVLLIDSAGRTFAATFGTGFHALDPTWVEPDFGLRVAANSIDPAKLNLAEARGLGKGARNAVSSLPVPNRLFALRLSTDEEWIRRVGGKSLDREYALSLSGADSLRLTVDGTTLWDLPTLLRRTIDLFESNAYESYLPQLNNFRRLAKQHHLVPRLEEQALQDVRSRHTDIGFAAPDEFHFYDVDRFVLKRGRRSVELLDLSTEGVYGAIDELDAWDKPLDSVKVTAIMGDVPLGPPKPLQQYLVADVPIIDHDGTASRYVLTAGAWFSIAPSYAAHLDEVLAKIPELTADTLNLPEWDDTWLEQHVEGDYREDRYNRHAADVTGFALVDRDLFYGPAGERVEACDLLSSDKQLVCVKRLDGSGTMIHLFEQGAVSATMLKKNDDYKTFVLERLDAAGGGRDYGMEADWTVVFAIATSRKRSAKELLPFFARASLAANIDAITDRGYNVALVKIEMK
jgi:uncharacterized protein (TIGR04141 family)